MKLDGIDAFVAAVETGSISEAARRLRLSKSVVSERLAELERSLDAKLIQRTTRKLSLTEDGAAFWVRAERIAREAAEAVADLAERRGELSGPLRLAAPVTFGRLHLGPALYPFLAQHPEIRLTLDLDDRRVDAAADGFDAVLRHGRIDDSRLTVWRLAPSRRALVAAPDYLARQGAPATIAELARHDGLFYANRGAADWRFLSDGKAVTAEARARLYVNNGDMLRDAAIAGLGVALLPMFVIGEPLRRGALALIDVDVQPELEFIYIAHPQGRQPSAKLRALAEHLRLAFGAPPYWESDIGDPDRHRTSQGGAS